MRLEKLQLEDTNQFGELFLKYLREDSSIRDFYNNSPTLEGIKQQIALKKFPDSSRAILASVLQDQYSDMNTSAQVDENIEALKNPNTFTVTTGHQLNILTGPLYFVYKIVSTINLAKTLNERFPDYHFVPIYWMASEDHDFEEISKTHVGDHVVKWNDSQGGAVGRFSPAGMLELLKDVPAGTDVFKKAYSSGSLAKAVQYYVNDLFGEEGLVVLEPDSKELKTLLIPAIEDDLFKQSSFGLVNTQIEKLQDQGYSSQVNPREINYFYLLDNLRERIIQKGEKFFVNNTDLSFTLDEMAVEIKSYPERFSPNVIMRPLYQEIILPNLAYLGGPSEVIYWLEYKEMFRYFDISMPVLLPRNFVLFIDKPTSRKMIKAGLEIGQLFIDRDKLYQEQVLSETTNTLNLEEQKGAIAKQLEKVQSLATAIDPTLRQMVEAESTKISNRLKTIEKKMVRAEKRQKSNLLRQVDSVFDNISPSGKVQERYLNILTFLDDYPILIQQLLDHLDPLDFSMNVLVADD